MNKSMLLCGLLLVLFFLTAGCISNAGTNHESTPPPTNYVAEVDHILLIPDDPEALLSLFIETFQLYEGWPYSDFGNYFSGGISFGNADLEMLRFKDFEFTGIFGVALEPTMPVMNVKSGLEERGIDSWEPEHFPAFSWLRIGNILYQREIFFCEFHVPTSSELNESNPAGIESIQEITVEVRRYDQALDYWGRLFEPVLPTEPGYWELGSGPAFRLVQGNEDNIVSIQFEVESLERAESFLRDNGLLGEMRNDSLFTDPKMTNQILFEFKE